MCATTSKCLHTSFPWGTWALTVFDTAGIDQCACKGWAERESTCADSLLGHEFDIPEQGYTVTFISGWPSSFQAQKYSSSRVRLLISIVNVCRHNDPSGFQTICSVDTDTSTVMLCASAHPTAAGTMASYLTKKPRLVPTYST